jgi:hypothetical protein
MSTESCVNESVDDIQRRTLQDIPPREPTTVIVIRYKGLAEILNPIRILATHCSLDIGWKTRPFG